MKTIKSADKADRIDNIVGLPGNSQIRSLRLGGYLKSRLESNERLWLHSALRNNPSLFEIFETRESNPRCIVPWFGEYPGKILTGMALTYRMSGNPDTLKAGNEWVDRLEAVQGADGYLGPHPENRRFSGRMHEDAKAVFGWGNSPLWDVWGHYHCIYGLYQWYIATGNKKALVIAVRAADSVIGYFIRDGRDFSSAGSQEMNLAIGHAFVLLYRETGNRDYLSTAQQVVEEWKKPGCGNWFADALSGKDFYEMEKPRWEALHCVMTLAELYRTTGQNEYFTALESIWQSIARTDRHNDGGFSSDEGAVGDPYRLGAIETCCTVAWMALGTEYLKLGKRSLTADELELSFFNAALGSLTENDYIFTYNVPMSGQRIGADITLKWQTTENARDMNCCQANGNRGLSQVAEWAAFSDKTGMYLNFYSPYAMTAYTPSGQIIKVVQNTDYPISGTINITVELENAEEFPLHIRIPCWSADTALYINGEECMNIAAGRYYTIDRVWNNGDSLSLRLDMSAHYLTGEGAVSGRTSVYHGPVLMTLDSLVSGTDIDICSFDRKMLDNMTVKDGTDGHWLTAEVVDTEGKSVLLVDFASSGRGGSHYISWLNIRNSPSAVKTKEKDLPVWASR
ncbi:MAG: glycoside hydrolase family 127 protein [Eubacteriales bacterium]|nr:glycoside hydrolase family 127 protein [Eubacteriales bacterium]